MPTGLRVAIMEIAMVLGCFVALFTVPRATPLRTFVIICIGCVVCCNVWLWFALRKRAVNAERKANPTRLFTGLGLVVIYWILHFAWK